MRTAPHTTLPTIASLLCRVALGKHNNGETGNKELYHFALCVLLSKTPTCQSSFTAVIQFWDIDAAIFALDGRVLTDRSRVRAVHIAHCTLHAADVDARQVSVHAE
jgi:hypothetical protein